MLDYEVYSKLWRYDNRCDYAPIGTYKLGSVEIRVQDCDGDNATLSIKRNGEVVIDKYCDYENEAYKEAEDYLVAIGFLVRDEAYREMEFPKETREQKKERAEQKREKGDYAGYLKILRSIL